MAVMQKWQLEVCKMFMYMVFPVTMFHYFNSPQFFEEAVTKVKHETCPPMTQEQMDDVENMIHKINMAREDKIMKEMEGRKNRS